MSIFCKNIPIDPSLIHEISNFPRDKTVNYALGDGGGKHTVYNQYIVYQDSKLNDSISEQDQNELKVLQPLVDKMLEIFKSEHSEVKIDFYQIEHRLYEMDEKVFQGHIHEDECPYTIICYYKIDSGIRGGELSLYDKNHPLYFSKTDAYTEVETHTPASGDVVIFSGYHGVKNLSATADSVKCHQNQRAILTVFINGGPM